MNKNWRFVGFVLFLSAAVAVLTWTLTPGASITAKAAADAIPASSAPMASATGASAPGSQHTLQVQGEGKIQVDPDVAYINVGVETQADTAQAAQSANAKAFSDLSAVLKQYQIDDKDVSTTGFMVQPQYQYDNGKAPKITGYQAVHSVQVTYRKLDKLGTLLDAMSAAGANRINGVQFGTEKQQQYELQALTKAMDDAKAKADTLAQYAGSKVTGILRVEENGSGGPVRVYANVAGASASASSAGASTDVQPGHITITSNVTVVYSF